MKTIKHPPIYFNPENSLEISFSRKRGYRVVKPCLDCAFMAYRFDNADQVEGARRLLEGIRDTYCMAWDKKAGLLAYTDRDMDGQDWEDLRTQ